jgi:hypothetical protein
MPPTALFWLSLGVTVLLIVATMWTGWRGPRRLHLVVGPLTMGALAITIVLTEQLMAHYTFPDDTKAIHLPCAKAGGLLALPVILTGVWLWRSPHKLAVYVWLLSVLVATCTGLWMFAHGTPKVG